MNRLVPSMHKWLRLLAPSARLSLRHMFDKHVFERFYVCLDACRKGFLTGCRRVIGLDGCWFKGANNGELLCAIGRDANNQIIPYCLASRKRHITHDTGFLYWYRRTWTLMLEVKDGYWSLTIRRYLMSTDHLVHPTIIRCMLNTYDSPYVCFVGSIEGILGADSQCRA